jgi:hypothetical protein
VTPERHGGTGAVGTGLAVPSPDEPISADNRAVAHFVGSRSPPRPRLAEGPSSKVSQNAGALKLQFGDARNVDGEGGGGGGAAVYVTLADTVADPPTPVQVRV